MKKVRQQHQSKTRTTYRRQKFKSVLQIKYEDHIPQYSRRRNCWAEEGNSDLQREDQLLHRLNSCIKQAQLSSFLLISQRWVKWLYSLPSVNLSLSISPKSTTYQQHPESSLILTAGIKMLRMRPVSKVPTVLKMPNHAFSDKLKDWRGLGRWTNSRGTLTPADDREREYNRVCQFAMTYRIVKTYWNLEP